MSVQDAELKLFPEETPGDAAAPRAEGTSPPAVESTARDSIGSGGGGGGGTAMVEATKTTVVAATAVNEEGTKKKKKKKKKKKQPAVTQRGPLLITHSGEMDGCTFP